MNYTYTNGPSSVVAERFIFVAVLLSPRELNLSNLVGMRLPQHTLVTRLATIALGIFVARVHFGAFIAYSVQRSHCVPPCASNDGSLCLLFFLHPCPPTAAAMRDLFLSTKPFRDEICPVCTSTEITALRDEDSSLLTTMPPPPY